jgi:hypothetical protein
MVTLRYAEVLRTIGRLMEAEGAQVVEIRDDDDLLTICWEDSTGQVHTRSYDLADLQQFVRGATRIRGHEKLVHGELESLLRTLGQDLDREGIRLSRVRETRGFQVQGLSDGHWVERCYSLDELRTKNRERQTPLPPPAPLRWSWGRLWALGKGRATLSNVGAVGNGSGNGTLRKSS